MNDTSRKILIEAIVTFMVKNKMKPGKGDFDRISNEIEREFKDDKVYTIYIYCLYILLINYWHLENLLQLCWTTA